MVTDFLFLSGMTLARSWSVGRVPAVHISKHLTLFMVLELSRSRSVVRRARVQAFEAVGTSTRADACAFTRVPQPRLVEFTSL